MHAAEDHARERERRNLRGVVAGLEKGRQALLPKAFELRLRERWPQSDVCHQRQRSFQPRRRDVEPYGGRIERAARFERGAEEFDVVSDL